LKARIVALVVSVAVTALLPAHGGADGARHAWTRANVVRVAMTTEPNSLDPLVAVAADGRTLLPRLAREVPTQHNGGISRDGRTLTWHLRRDVRWQDGAPFTSRDVRFTFAAIANPKNNVANRRGFDLVTSVATPDPYTVVVRLRSAFSPAVTWFFGDGSPYALGGIFQNARFDLATYTMTLGIDPDSSGRFMCDARPPRGQNYSRYCNAAVDVAERRGLASYDRGNACGPTRSSSGTSWPTCRWFSCRIPAASMRTVRTCTAITRAPSAARGTPHDGLSRSEPTITARAIWVTRPRRGMPMKRSIAVAAAAGLLATAPTTGSAEAQSHALRTYDYCAKSPLTMGSAFEHAGHIANIRVLADSSDVPVGWVYVSDRGHSYVQANAKMSAQDQGALRLPAHNAVSNLRLRPTSLPADIRVRACRASEIARY